jgi:hypothetical protein
MAKLGENSRDSNGTTHAQPPSLAGRENTNFSRTPGFGKWDMTTIGSAWLPRVQQWHSHAKAPSPCRTPGGSDRIGCAFATRACRGRINGGPLVYLVHNTYIKYIINILFYTLNRAVEHVLDNASPPLLSSGDQCMAQHRSGWRLDKRHQQPPKPIKVIYLRYLIYI